MNDLIKNSEYMELIERIEQIINQAKYNIAKSVNTNMVQAYWNIGKYIVEFEQGGSFKAKYGEALLANLSKDLRLKLGRGYSRPNLNNMRKFYKYYPICQNISDKLSWSHFCELIKLDDELERKFYEKQIENEKWNVETLKRQIKYINRNNHFTIFFNINLYYIFYFCYIFYSDLSVIYEHCKSTYF